MSIVATVFGLGLKATPADLLYLIRKPSLLIRSLVSVFVLMPLVAMAAGALVRLRIDECDCLGGACDLACAAAASAQGRESGRPRLLLSGAHGAPGRAGHRRWSRSPSRSSNGSISGRSRCRRADIARIILIAAVLPLIAGLAVRALLPGIADRIEKPVSLVANVLLPLAVIALLAGTWRLILGATGGGAVLAMVVFVVTGMSDRPPDGRPETRAFGRAGPVDSCRHPGIALAIAATNYPGMHFGGTILLYTIVSAIIGIPYLAWQRKQVAASATPDELEW